MLSFTRRQPPTGFDDKADLDRHQPSARLRTLRFGQPSEYDQYSKCSDSLHWLEEDLLEQNLTVDEQKT